MGKAEKWKEDIVVQSVISAVAVMVYRLVQTWELWGTIEILCNNNCGLFFGFLLCSICWFNVYV